METSEKLDKLSLLQQSIDVNREQHNKVKESLIPSEIKAELDRMDSEFEERQSTINKEIDGLITEIKLDVINHKATIKGQFQMAVYNKARVTWDNKGLEGFMVAHPEIVAFRKEGEPTVTIRKIGKGE